MIDQTILGCIMLGLQSSEQRLFGTKDLHGRRRVLGQAQQAAGMADQTGTNELADKGSQVGGDRAHTVAEVFSELAAVLGY